jgi:hypothetical protein
LERLIHADANLNEIGVIESFNLFDAQQHRNCDLADNTFSLEMSVGAWQEDKIMRGDYVYLDQTEFGGIVRSVTKNTSADTVTIKGVLWRGLLAMRIICPPENEAYLVYTDTELNTMIADVIGTDYAGLFQVSEESTGATVSYQFRYQTKLYGLSKALSLAGYSLSCVYDATLKKVITQARQCVDYSSYADISSDLGIGLTITAGRVDDYNHMIALGQGELTERMVREIWMLNGRIYYSKPSILAEKDIRSITFDYPNAESEDELLSSAESALLEYAPVSSAEVDLTQLQEELSLDLQLGDTILTVDRDLNLSETKTVSQRILTISADSGIQIRTEVD